VSIYKFGTTRRLYSGLIKSRNSQFEQQQRMSTLDSRALSIRNRKTVA
jgi:hypothetical protein